MAIHGNRFHHVSKADFCLNNYLTARQRSTFHTLDLRLKEMIKLRFLSSRDPKALMKVGLTLDIIALCPDIQVQKTAHLFFLTFLNHEMNESNPDDPWIKLKKICQLTHGTKTFFKCASTKKVNYYTLSILRGMIDKFSDCLSPEDKSIPSYLNNLPSYDEGGELFLTKMGQKISYTALPIVEATDSPSRLQNQPTTLLKEILAKSMRLKDMKGVINSYLSSLPATHSLSQTLYTHFFDFIQNSPQTSALKDPQRVQLLKIMLVTTCCPPSHSRLFHYNTFEDLKEMVINAVTVCKDCGEEMFNAFCEGLYRQTSVSLDETIHALKLFHLFFQEDERFNDLQNYLDHFRKGSMHLTDLLRDLQQFSPHKSLPIDAADDIQILMQRFAGNDPNVKVILDSEKRRKLKENYLQIETYCHEWQQCRMSELVNKANEIRQKDLLDDMDLLKLIGIGRLALRIKFFPIYLHPTQVLTVLGLLEHPRGCIAQVKTGEGKSMIVSLLAFILTMQKKNVHIISSSQTLAQRDQYKFRSFFYEFGVTSSHICTQQREPEYFEAQLLYGTASDYKFALMKEKLYGVKLFPKEFKDARAIVDEVDNLTIDTALSGARLSYPAENTLQDWVYMPMAKFLKQHISLGEKFKLESPDLLSHLKSYLQNQQGKLVDAFSDERLKNWLSSACHAFYELEENKNYIIENVSDPSGDTKRKIVIIDHENTGKRMEGCRWSGGIHEFVEIKHGIEAERESITPISMTNPIFYSFYPTVYGLTGTAGSISDRDEIKKVYGLDSFDVPTHKPPLRKDFPPLIFLDNTHYMQAILNRITTCRQQGRPILILCRTIHDTLILEEKLRHLQIPHEIMNEKQQKEEEAILEHAGLPGAVTVATNNAGRGTDIQLKGDSKKNGGLHVLITFYPESLRVEEQARGRGGRQGEPGTSEIYLSAQALGLNLSAEFNNPQFQKKIIQDLADGRNAHGQIMKQIHLCQASLDKFNFNLVTQFYQKLRDFDALLEDNYLLNQYAITLSNRILNKQKPNFSTLHPKDKSIAEEAFKLLQRSEGQPTQWIVLLKKAGQRIREKLINAWAIHFIAQVEEMIRLSKIHQLSSLRQIIRHFSHNAFDSIDIPEEKLLLNYFLLIKEQQVIDSMRQELDKLQSEIQHLYDAFLLKWDKDLDVHGIGILDYLGQLLDIKLPLVCHKPQQMIGI